MTERIILPLINNLKSEHNTKCVQFKENFETKIDGITLLFLFEQDQSLQFLDLYLRANSISRTHLLGLSFL